MSERTALSISVGVFGVLSTLLTATVWNLPVWVLFLAWASFFFVGSGWSGFVNSVLCNWTGIAIATATMLFVNAVGGGALVLSVAVGIGSFAMIQVSRFAVIAWPPAIVFGFAMTVGTSAATGHSITTASIGNPAIVAAATVVVGALFGVASERCGVLVRSAAGGRRTSASRGVPKPSV